MNSGKCIFVKLFLTCILVLTLLGLGKDVLGNPTDVTPPTEEIKFKWDVPTERIDGTPLTDLKGHIIYYGIESGNYTENITVGNISEGSITVRADGKRYFIAITAFDEIGNESQYSNEINKAVANILIPNPPKTPTGCSFVE